MKLIVSDGGATTLVCILCRVHPIQADWQVSCTETCFVCLASPGVYTLGTMLPK